MRERPPNNHRVFRARGGPVRFPGPDRYPGTAKDRLARRRSELIVRHHEPKPRPGPADIVSRKIGRMVRA
jgi:hypothetical protein